MAERKQPRRRLVGRAVAGDHVGRDGPGRAAKADQRRLGRQFLAQPPNRLVDRFEIHVKPFAVESLDIADGNRRHQRSLSLLEAEIAAKRMRHHEDIRKQD